MLCFSFFLFFDCFLDLLWESEQNPTFTMQKLRTEHRNTRTHLPLLLELLDRLLLEECDEADEEEDEDGEDEEDEDELEEDEDDDDDLLRLRFLFLFSRPDEKTKQKNKTSETISRGYQRLDCSQHKAS